jgi:hypothetical protein
VRVRNALLAFGVRLVCVWCAFGVRLVCVWCAFGVRLVCVWCAFGALLVRFWCAFGVLLVCFWCAFGALLGCVCCACGAYVIGKYLYPCRVVCSKKNPGSAQSRRGGHPDEILPSPLPSRTRPRVPV